MRTTSIVRLALALALATGATLVGVPDGSAHDNTDTVSEVAGTVTWPAGMSCTTQSGASVGPNADEGLPVSGGNDDLCFDFVDVLINAVGTVNNTVHQTDFACTSEGVTGHATGDPGFTGAFDGDFDCTVVGGAAPLSSSGFPDGNGPNGHFHGVSEQGTIAFMGAIDQHNASNSVLEHTLQCAGQVRGLTPDDDASHFVEAGVTLECTIS